MSWTLPELIDVPSLQRLMDRFHTATGIPVGILDVEGNILVATGWQEICTNFHRCHPVTAERCRQSDDYVKTHIQPQSFVEYKCRNGLWDMAKPIIIAGETVANLYLGQFFYDDEEVDEEFFRGQAHEFGFDPESYMAALRRVPVFSREKIRQIMEFYSQFVDFLVSMGLANYRTKEAEITLQESEEKYSKAFHSAPSIFSITTLTDGTFVEVNESFERSFGYKREDIIGRSSLALNVWENPDDRNRMIRMLRKEGKVRDQEIIFRHKSGKLLVGLYSAEIIHIKGEEFLLSLSSDITERKRSEAALRESEARFRTVVEQSPVGVVIARDLKILYANSKYAEMHGYGSADAMLGLSLEAMVAPGSWEKFVARARNREKGLPAETTYETMGVRKDGSEFNAMVMAACIDLADGPAAIGYVQDITERKEMERMKDEMISAVSHEMRTPLTAMLGYIEYILRNEVGEVQLREYLGTVHRETERLNELISNFLDMQRLRAKQGFYCFKTLAVRPLLAEAAALFANASTKHTISIHCGQDLPPLFGDERGLHQVLNNLLSNAIKYSPFGGEIILGARREENGMILWVKDEGIGIPQDSLDMIFDRFFRVDNTPRRATGGTGLGLALVREIVRAHGGRVWAESTFGKGSTFYVFLPIKNGA